MSKYGPDSRTPGVKVLNYFLITTSIIAVLIRLGTKLWKFRSLFRDDIFIIASLLLSIGQSVAVSVEVNNGYGDRSSTLSNAQLHSILVAQYSATLLYIASMCFSKLSLASFVGYLTPSSQDRVVSICTHVAVGVWAVTGIFASAFQCTPRPWDYLNGDCINRRPWLTYLGVSNIVTDLAIIAQAIKIVIRLQTNRQRKASLMTVFIVRLIVSGAIAGRIATIYSTTGQTDPIRDTWPTSIMTQIIQCLSIVTASIPQLIPFLRNLNSSGMDLAGMSRHLASGQKTTRTGKSILSLFSRSRTENRSGHELDSMRKPASKTFITTVSKGTHSSKNQDFDGTSQSSQAGMIRETRTWAVTSEEHPYPSEHIRGGMTGSGSPTAL